MAKTSKDLRDPGGDCSAQEALLRELRDEEQRLREALAERTKHLEAVLSNVAQGIVILDPNLRVVLTNPGLHDLVGYPRRLGKPGTHVRELIRDRLKHGLYLPGEKESGLPDEEIVERRLRAYKHLKRECYRHPFPGDRLVEIKREKLPDGTIVCTFSDVTEQDRAERELRQQREALHQHEKLSALGMLLAGVAHELNNPLSVVLGQAVLMEETSRDEAVRERAQRVRKAAERCAKIIKKFLAMARDEPAIRVTVDLGELIAEALNLLSFQLAAENIEVIEELAPELPPISGDPDQLNQVVVNLLMNAIQAMEGSDRPKRLILRSARLSANQEVLLEIADSGPGIPESMQKRIFDPFFTTKRIGSGSGIGLSLCHAIVTAHGGTISVQNGKEGGACFRVRLPAAARPKTGLAALDFGDDGRQAGHVLVIDDEPEICDLLMEFLEQGGLSGEAAGDGRDALSRLLSKDFDAVICDLRVPGLDGPALFRSVQRLRPELAGRFVFATGDQLSDQSRRFLADSGRPCLEKPFMPEQVLRIVGQVARRGRGQGEGEASPAAESGGG